VTMSKMFGGWSVSALSNGAETSTNISPKLAIVLGGAVLRGKTGGNRNG